MANPQQPELARRRKTPNKDQDSVAAVVDGQRDVGADAPRGPVPSENQPGHHPEHEQDKPDLDAFAEKFGIETDGTAGERTERTEGPGRPQELAAAARSSKAAVFGVAAAVLSVLVAVGLLLSRKRRRSGLR
jgi:hypothetical protein